MTPEQRQVIDEARELLESAHGHYSKHSAWLSRRDAWLRANPATATPAATGPTDLERRVGRAIATLERLEPESEDAVADMTEVWEEISIALAMLRGGAT